METVKLIEVITTFQGEGPDSGQRMLLCRFKKCNRNCSWCDTAVKMRVEHEGIFHLTALQDIINNDKCGLMITGGEPTIPVQIDQTVNLLNKLDYPTANVETNGYRLMELISKVKPSKNVKYIWSPKIFNSADYDEAFSLLNDINDFPSVFIKLVYEDRLEVIEFLKVASGADINNRIYIMPKGITQEELLSNAPNVFDIAEEYQVNFSSRQHIIFNFV
ncbi:7-carboxy-7-deazaguanine synthase QueE [Candidatus Pacearchaeota archaeon]|nr:7-carboxy-7-deazaguanine synthase QueE [Candidatus Pacearchaeota archaeon]